MFEGMTREGGAAVIAGRDLPAHYRQCTCTDVLRSLGSDGRFDYLLRLFFCWYGFQSGRGARFCPLTMPPRGVSAKHSTHSHKTSSYACQLPSTKPAEGVASTIFSFLRTTLMSSPGPRST